mmetsp:Transcript_28475/g.53348  ORF Transcript_28475/g.53348 Transcript_28475/m.53348 type:complete len:417 (-) Transcript_28475:13-1263(-)
MSAVQIVDHALGDQADAVIRPPEPGRIHLRVLAHNQSFWNDHAAIDHHVFQTCLAVDFAIRHRHHPFELGIGMRAHTGEQKTPIQGRTRDDAPTRHHGRHRMAAPPFLIVDELGGRREFRIGPDGPGRVIKVEFGIKVGQVHIGLPERIDRSHIAPVWLFLKPAAHARPAKGMGHRLARGHDVGNDIAAKVVIVLRVFRSSFQEATQVLGFEHVDAHAGQRHVGMTGHGGGIGGLFHEIEDLVGFIHFHHAKGAGLHPGDLDTADGHIRAAFDVLFDHQGIVLLVNMVARQNDDVFRAIAANDVDVLGDSVSGAFVPVLVVQLLRGGQDIQALIALGPEKAPAPLQVADQRVRLVLGGDANATDARIDGVRQGKVDDPTFAAEIHRRFGPPVGQFIKPAAAPTCQNKRHRLLREPL